MSARYTDDGGAVDPLFERAYSSKRTPPEEKATSAREATPEREATRDGGSDATARQ